MSDAVSNDPALSDALLAAYDEASARWSRQSIEPVWEVLASSEWTEDFTSEDWTYLASLGQGLPVPDDLAERHQDLPLLTAATLGMNQLASDRFDRWRQEEWAKTEAAFARSREVRDQELEGLEPSLGLNAETTVLRCGACEDHGRPGRLVAFPITTKVGAISTHSCGARVLWTGEPPTYMKTLSDPDDAKGYVVIATLLLPAVAGLLLGGLSGALIGFVASLVFLLFIRGLRDAFDGRFTWWIGWWW